MKILTGPGAASDRALKRFRREVAAAAKLDHENLVRLLDHGVDPVAGPYLVMPLFEGQTLRRFTADRRLSPLAAALVAAPLLDGLAALHAAGLVHRDLKPENVLLTPAGRLVIVDLGLAVQDRDTRLTSDGAVVGSVPYMSPEQIEGQRVGPASDLWSLGVMIHEWIAGRRPFARARQTEEVAAILKADHQPLTSVDRRTPPALAALVAACLQVDPGRRPRHAGELVERMEALLDWFRPGQRQAELASLVNNPVGYEHGLSAVDKGRLAATARRAIQAGDGFEALKLLDRALAHGPDDSELEFLVDRATAACARAQARVHAPNVSPKRRRFRLGSWLALALMAGVGAVGARWWLAPQAAANPTPPAATVAGSGGRGPHPIQRAAHTDTATAETMFLVGLAPIPLDALPDRRPPVKVEQVADPGEPLVPARLFGAQGPESALASIEAQMTADPSDRELPVGRALALMGCGRRDEGLTALGRIVERSPRLAVAWAALGFVRLRQGDLSAAETAFTRAIELDPQRVDALRNRGILRHRLGRVRQAYQDLVAALRADPDDLQAARELANVYEKTGRRSQVLPLVEHIVRLGPTDPTAWLDLAVVRSDPARKLAAIERALDLSPGLPRALRMRCTERTAQHHPQAVAACDAALRVGGEDASVRMHRGLALFYAGDDEGALTDLDRAVASGKDDADSLVNRAIVRTHAGRLAGARADLKAACDLGHIGACGERVGP